jgi:hypothetical protein
MPNKPARSREIFRFTISEVFPPSDPVAMHLLCLMAQHNDLGFVGDWIRAHLEVPASKPAVSIAANRLFFLQRIFASMVVEVLQTLEALEELPDFAAVRGRLDEDGRQALDVFHTVPVDPKQPIYRVLHRTRNKAAFHFDPKQFQSSLNKMLARYGHDAESEFIAEDVGGGYSRVYYQLAAQVAIEASFGLPAIDLPPLTHEEFSAALDLQEALSQFIQSVQGAFIKARGLGQVFRRAVD